MKNLNVLLISLLILFNASGQAFSQKVAKAKKGKAESSSLEKSLLWKIEGNGIETSYLYGTIHILPKSDLVLSQATKDAFKSSDQVVMELDMDDPGMQMEMMKHIPMKDGMTLDKLLNAEDYKKLDQLLQASYGAGIQVFNTWKPFMASALLMKNFVSGEIASYEAIFVEHAKEQKLEILGLETPEEQLTIFDKIPYSTQAKDLSEMINDEEKVRKSFTRMMELYKDQDIDGLNTFIVEYYNDPKQTELLLNKRNKAWISKITDHAGKKSTFFAVGAGHLPGDIGLINLLKKEGFTVTPVN